MREWGSERLGYRPALDGVRAIAVSAVVLWHATGYPAQGGLGVDVFFVLSGFLITTLLLEEHAANGVVSLRSFYVRRARRLLPALFVLLVVFVLIEVPRGFTESDAVGVAGALGYCTNLLMSFGLGHPATALSHLWSLSLEEQFYLLWPAVLLILLRANRRAAAGLLGLVILVTTLEDARLFASGASGWRLNQAPDTRSVSLAVGCLTAIVLASGRLRLSGRSRRWVELLALSVVLLVLLLAPTPEQWFHRGLLLVFACATATLLVTTLDGTSAIGRALSLPPFVWLGKVSYSLYLWHIPVFVALGLVHAGNADTTGPWTRLAALALSLTLAAGSYYFVERPLRWPRRRPTIAVRRTPATATAE